MIDTGALIIKYFQTEIKQTMLKKRQNNTELIKLGRVKTLSCYYLLPNSNIRLTRKKIDRQI